MTRASLWPFDGRATSLLVIALALLVLASWSVQRMADPHVQYLSADIVEEDDEEPIFVAIIWHFHQPFYEVDDDGLFKEPWVRAHALKDYLDMVAKAEDYSIPLTFNLAPSLMLQIEALIDGAEDRHLHVTKKPAEDLTEDDKRFMLESFFSLEWDTVVIPNKGYLSLLEKRGFDDQHFQTFSPKHIDQGLATYSVQDYRDLQIWYTLGWFDPDMLKTEPLKALVDKGSGFSEEDKKTVLTEQERVIADIPVLYRRLQEEGKASFIMSPMYHPIIPLLINTSVVKEDRKNTQLPEVGFSWFIDAQVQVDRSVSWYEKFFGSKPTGMWLSEGAVSPRSIDLLESAGIRWTVLDDQMLPCAGESGCYLPARLGDGDVVGIIRLSEVSESLGSVQHVELARSGAGSLIRRIKAISSDGGSGRDDIPPPLYVILQDGENMWRDFPEDGNLFLHDLYTRLLDDPRIEVVTPDMYLDRYEVTDRIETVPVGSWIDGELLTWIGEKEENRAWEYLAFVRNDFEAMKASGDRTSADLELAYEEILKAEGSDWFWYYGLDRSYYSDHDANMDSAFRSTLKNVYLLLDEDAPVFLDEPIYGLDVAEKDRP
ncbi:MAG: hypothetical protein ABIC95_04445 [archaeon]